MGKIQLAVPIATPSLNKYYLNIWDVEETNVKIFCLRLLMFCDAKVGAQHQQWKPINLQMSLIKVDFENSWPAHPGFKPKTSRVAGWLSQPL